MPEFDYYSFTSLPITMMSNLCAIGPATGFILESEGAMFLVSNWHVFSGRNCYTGQAMHSSGAVPDSLELTLHTRTLGKCRAGFVLPLYRDNGDSIWIQHEKGQEFDIAAIRLNPPPELDIKFYPANFDQTENLASRVGHEVFVLGFPRGLTMQGILPVWKRGTIASEPEADLADGTPVILIDSASREGMSGSPVFRRAFGVAQFSDGETAILRGHATRLVGVYSGRFGSDDEFAAQLGRVWRISVVMEMLGNPFPGSYAIKRA